MIGTVSVSELVPLEYRIALDAVTTRLSPPVRVMVLCGQPELTAEVRQRIPIQAKGSEAGWALWIEPLVNSWRDDIEQLGDLRQGSGLAVVASRPLASFLPERRSWGGDPLGTHPGGLAALQSALFRAGFVAEPSYGIHSLKAIVLNVLSDGSQRLGRPELADRLGFAARLGYCTSGKMAALSTVALLLGHKKGDRG